MRKSFFLLLAVFAVASLSGCQYFKASSAAIVDGVGSYCDSTGELGRLALRDQLRPELVSEGLEICLGCEGEETTACTGLTRPKVDDPIPSG